MVSRSIGEIADAAGVAASTIRYYERIGLLPEPARRGGKRRYHEETIGRLELIRIAKGLGFTLDEVRTLLDGIEAGDPTPRKLRTLARTKLPAVEATIAEAELVRKVLTAITRCRCPTLKRCLSQVDRLAHPSR